jgi:sporadic carbohydrate cluster protein (TIGR04323 family)
MIKIFTYALPRSFNGQNIPISVQSAFLRDYCLRNGYNFTLPTVEICVENSYYVLLRNLYLRRQNKLNIGLSWSTSNKKEQDTKGINLDKFLEIFRKKNINLINLQFGDVKDEISSFKDKNKVEFYEFKNLNITKEIDKLMSLINKLDLVITIQNTTAHLALSIGKKTCVLLSYAPPRFYWYGPNTEKSYWYPEATLYRQKDANDDWSKILSNKVGIDLDLIKKD